MFGDDPTVLALEQRTAAILGKEAALYMPSGTMCNQLAVRAHTEPGDELFLAQGTHLLIFEGGGPAAFSGVTSWVMPTDTGIFGPDDLDAALRPRNVHFPRPRLVCVENTHNLGGGAIWPLEQIHAVADWARDHDLKLHLDGARLWNASAASGIPEGEYAAPFDSVSVCFSKGLGAPVGSALAGSRAFIDRVARFRKMVGGGMRQAGIIAAAALYAIEHHRDRLVEDHANAKALAAGLAEIPGIAIDPDRVETNLVYFRTVSMPAPELVTRLRERGVLVVSRDESLLRAVTSLEVDRGDVGRAVAAFAEVLV